MKRYLLPENGNYYKANLHCHSNISDGRLSPEEIKKAYMDKGYSIVAYTDHDVLIDHSDLQDENFLPLNGFEVEIMERTRGVLTPKQRRRCHICFVALEPDNLTQICWHREKYLFGNAPKYKDQVKFDENEPDYERAYTPERINDMMRRGREGGFFVTYNHPIWSMEKPSIYLQYEGMHAMEIFNTSSYVTGRDEYVPQYYDHFLWENKRIFCVATDDNHNGAPLDALTCDSFGGYIMIKADKLDYRTVTKAMEAGNFYASMNGPEIYDLWFEDGQVHLRCSPSTRVAASFGALKGVFRYGTAEAPITELTFKLDPDDIYFRLSLTNAQGGVTNTNAYFCDQLFD